MIIGGYAGEGKVLTKQCSFYSIDNSLFYQKSSLNNFHSCPSGCVHNEKIFIFSSEGIECYSHIENVWMDVEMPKRLRNLPY